APEPGTEDDAGDDPRRSPFTDDGVDDVLLGQSEQTLEHFAGGQRELAEQETGESAHQRQEGDDADGDEHADVESEPEYPQHGSTEVDPLPRQCVRSWGQGAFMGR